MFILPLIITGKCVASFGNMQTMPPPYTESTPISRPGYYLTFFDSFTGNPDTLPSSNKWIIDLGTSYPGGAARWGNDEYETYTDSTANIHLTNASTLLITPLLSAAATWTSGRIETQRCDFAAGQGGKLYIEARIKLGGAPASEQQGIWSAFWALGSSFRGNYTNWPMASEWDFMEVVNGLPTMYETLHCGYAPGGPCDENDGIGSGGVCDGVMAYDWLRGGSEHGWS